MKREGLSVHCSDYGCVGREVQGSVTGKASENTQVLVSCSIGVGQGSGVFKLCLVRRYGVEDGMSVEWEEGEVVVQTDEPDLEHLHRRVCSVGGEVKSMFKNLL